MNPPPQPFTLTGPHPYNKGQITSHQINILPPVIYQEFKKQIAADKTIEQTETPVQMLAGPFDLAALGDLNFLIGILTDLQNGGQIQGHDYLITADPTPKSKEYCKIPVAIFQKTAALK